MSLKCWIMGHISNVSIMEIDNEGYVFLRGTTCDRCGADIPLEYSPEIVVKAEIISKKESKK